MLSGSPGRLARTTLGLLVAAIATILLQPVPSAAQNGTTPGQTGIYSTIYSVGVEWDISGDGNHNATVAVQYRPQGTSAWKSAMPLVRVDNAYNGNGFAGSIFFLAPDTTYDVLLTLSDPDGGAESRTLTVATRPLPTLPTDGRTFHVVPGSGGGDGSSGNPFKGIAAAQAVARPGDIFLVHAGTYPGRPTFSVPGLARTYVVWKAAGDGEALFSDGFNWGASHVWVEGLTVRNQAYATFSLDCPSDVVVGRNFFYNNHYNIYLQRGGEGWYIADNTIVGDVDPASGSLDGEGIELNGSFATCGANNHTVAHNSITHTADGISNPGTNVDLFGNDIFDVADDGIETDDGRANVRVWGNRIHNAAHNGFSFQPQTGAPWYFIRNQVVNNLEDINKYRTWDRAVFLHNTFVHWQDLTYVRADGQLMSISRNNLWISVNGGRIWGLSGSIDWRTDLDYDGFDWGASTSPFQLNGVNHSSLASFVSATGQEARGIPIIHAVCLPAMNVLGNSPTTVPPQYLTLATGCPAIDAGAILPNLNDGFSGIAPDLGAYETGAPLPVYGPRTEAPLPAVALKVYRAGIPITADGVLGEWGGAEGGAFSGTSSSGTASLLWDDTNLYVAFQVTDTQLNALATTRDDGNLWQDDAVEIYIDTRNDRAPMMQPDDYQFMVNLRNVKVDLRGTGSGKDPAWNGTWQSAVRLQGTLNSNGDTDGGYTVELVIPWAQIGVTPVAGMSLGLDLVVDDRDPAGPTTYETFDWAGIAPNSYAQPYLWKQVQLVDTLPPLGDTTPPSVALTSPAGGTSVSGTVPVAAGATDNVGVVGVQFKLDGANLGAEDTTAPYSVSWDTTTALNGTHTLTAAARDAAGNLGTSAGVIVTVASQDVAAPVISAVTASSITRTGATITWTTNEPSDTQVEYGRTTARGSVTTPDTTLVTSHSQPLMGLAPNTSYHYRVKSRDAAGNMAVSGDFTFKTKRK